MRWTVSEVARLRPRIGPGPWSLLQFSAENSRCSSRPPLVRLASCTRAGRPGASHSRWTTSLPPLRVHRSTGEGRRHAGHPQLRPRRCRHHAFLGYGATRASGWMSRICRSCRRTWLRRSRACYGAASAGGRIRRDYLYQRTATGHDLERGRSSMVAVPGRRPRADRARFSTAVTLRCPIRTQAVRRHAQR